LAGIVYKQEYCNLLGKILIYLIEFFNQIASINA